MSSEHEEDRRTHDDHSEKTLTTSTGRYCNDCGSYVTRDYHRVFSDRSGTLRDCLKCEGHGVPRGGNR